MAQVMSLHVKNSQKEESGLKPVKVGICGLGTVGGGTFNVLTRNAKKLHVVRVAKSKLLKLAHVVLTQRVIHKTLKLPIFLRLLRTQKSTLLSS